MFCVIFEVRPKPETWEAYLGLAALLRPELARIDGFIDNVRYASRRRPGLLLSLSVWRDEAALIRWRTHALHHRVQAQGRTEIFSDYRLRVGEIADRQPRPDVAESGGRPVTLVEARRPAGTDAQASPAELAAGFGMHDAPAGLAEWDVLEAILTPGDLLLLLSWDDLAEAASFVPEGRRRTVRIVRDYGMRERREAPQYFPPVA